jgi:hypothetical protein
MADPAHEQRSLVLCPTVLIVSVDFADSPPRPQRSRLDQRLDKADGRMGCASNNGGISLGRCPAISHSGRDRIYGTLVTRRLRAMGIRDKPIAPASPWQKGSAERLIGSILGECVEHSSCWVRRICAESCEPILAIITTSEPTGPWIKMRRSLAQSSGPEALGRAQSLAAFITTTSGGGFLVQTTLCPFVPRSWFKGWTLIAIKSLPGMRP